MKFPKDSEDLSLKGSPPLVVFNPVVEVPDSAAWPGLMAAAQDGNPAAYRRLLEALIPVVRKMIRRRISNPALVEDVIQDTLLTLHRIRHTYDPARPFLPWLSTIASARAIDGLRRYGRVSRREINDPGAFDKYIDPGSSIETLATKSQIAHLLTFLSPRQRRVVELVKIREMSIAEAAGQVDISTGALKTLLHRAIIKLRNVESAWHDEP